jgi:replicative DNA helicase
VPVIALSQLSRAVKLVVQVSDRCYLIFESGAIEQDADIVSFYIVQNIKIDEWDDDEACLRRVKQR